MRGEERAPANILILIKIIIIMMIIPGNSCALCLRGPARRQGELPLRGGAADREHRILMKL